MSGVRLVIEQGATFSRTITIKDASNVVVDITNDTFAGQVRKRHQAEPQKQYSHLLSLMVQTEKSQRYVRNRYSNNGSG